MRGKIMNIYLKSLLEEAYDTALEHEQYAIALQIAGLFNDPYLRKEDEQHARMHKALCNDIDRK